MCGILGIYARKNANLTVGLYQSVLRKLFLESQSRGKDSSGIAWVDPLSITISKQACAAQALVESSGYRELESKHGNTADFVLGHSRMETNGSFLEAKNNQPVVRGDWICVHNGILVNDQILWQQHPELQRQCDVDTEIFLALAEQAYVNGLPIIAALQQGAAKLAGSYSILGVHAKHNGAYFLTNTGSLYLLQDLAHDFTFFASEQLFLDRILSDLAKISEAHYAIEQVPAGTLGWLDFATGKITFLKANEVPLTAPAHEILEKKRDIFFVDPSVGNQHQRPRFQNNLKIHEMNAIVDRIYAKASRVVQQLRRCSRCILPETMPYIRFDAAGVCNYCHKHQNRETRGPQALKLDLDQILTSHAGKGKKANSPDCIVSFSGGRDSSFALHYVVRELGLKPVAYSYDWGMLTDLGRRNQARMTGQLGVEHVLIAADIQKKRANIRKNVSAWLKRPRLGMVPLFMAGDKQYFYYLNRLSQEMNIDLVLYADNALEKTDFKYGFADVELNPEVGKAYSIGLIKSLKLLYYYGKEFLLNPAYLNASLLDTFGAYLSSYAVPKEYLYLYRYLLWEEQEIHNTLVNEYDWELAPDTPFSWRIGDGTQPFYNLIYYAGAGFTEHDTFRSNQMREGAIARDRGLELAVIGNQPRVESLVWYFDTIGMDALSALKVIELMPSRLHQERQHQVSQHQEGQQRS